VKTWKQVVQVTALGGTSKVGTGTAGVDAIYYLTPPVVSGVASPANRMVKINGQKKDSLSGTTWTPPTTPFNRATIAGDDATFSGNGFVSVSSNANVKVTMGGLACAVVEWDNYNITCDMPNWGSAGNKAIQVSTTYGTSGTNVYVTAVAPPVISSITPNTGVLTTGGEVLTITGTGFQSEFTVTVDGVECADKTFVSSSSVKCTTPAGMAAGTRYVTVRTGYGSGSMGVEFVEPYIKISADKAGALVLVDPTTTGAMGTDRVTITTETNWRKGFALSIQEGVAGSSLVCGSGAGVGASLPITTDAVSTLDMNSWGVGVGTESAGPTSWRAVSSTPIVLSSLSTVGSTTTHLYYGARMDYGQAACEDYTGTVVVEAGVVL
jgi:hypothetical protein